MNEQRRIIVIAYDFIGEAIHDRVVMEDKMKRHRLWGNFSQLSLVWSRKRETIDLSPAITIESFPAFAGMVRPLYDFLYIFIAPWILLKRKERPDVISVNEFPLLWAAAVARLFVGGKVELTLNTLPTQYARVWGGKLHALYYRMHEVLAWRLADEYIAINEATRDYILDLGVHKEKVRIVTLDTIARDLHLLKDAKRGVVRERYNIPPSVPIVLAIGRLVADKGIDELLDVFKSSGIDARLLIVGHGVLHAELEDRARSLGLSEKVIFTGPQSRAEIWNFFLDADAFVLLSRAEALGLVFWEAMYMEVPVIGRPTGGIVETIGDDGERGFFWETKDGSEAFRRKLESAIRKEKDVQDMIKRAKDYIEHKIGPVIQSRP